MLSRHVHFTFYCDIKKDTAAEKRCVLAHSVLTLFHQKW